MRFRDFTFKPSTPKFVILRRLTPFDWAVVEVVKTITDARRGAYDKVFPHDVVVYVPAEVSIRHMQRIMGRLAEAGLLARISPRGGYRLAA